MSNNRKVILIADDDEKNRRVARDILIANGYSIIEAKDGRESLELARTKIPALIILDYNMPEMNGMEVTRTLKSDKLTKDIPCIMLTASAMSGDREKMLSAGCCDYISKPLDLKEFVSKVRKFVAETEPK